MGWSLGGGRVDFVGAAPRVNDWRLTRCAVADGEVGDGEGDWQGRCE